MLGMATDAGKHLSAIVEHGQKAAMPQVYEPIGEQSAARGTPYDVPPGVARGLNEALGLGLLPGPLMSNWPASKDGRPLSRIWEGIVAAMN